MEQIKTFFNSERSKNAISLRFLSFFLSRKHILFRNISLKLKMSIYGFIN